MQLDLQKLIVSLENGNETLVDGGYLDFDIRVLYDYYRNAEFKLPPLIKNYFDTHDDYEFNEFLKSYLESATGYKIELDYTNDGWLKIYGRTN